MHLAKEAEASARDCLNEPLLLAGVPNRAPRRIDPAGHGVIRYNTAVPNRLNQFVLAYDMVPMPDEISQNVEYLRLDMDGHAISTQLEHVAIDLAVAKGKDHFASSPLRI